MIPADHAPAVAQQMADRARRFLDGLSPGQRGAAHLPFAGDERYAWNYTPVARGGLCLKDMTAAQRATAFALQESGLSHRGAREARRIIDLEPILKEEERLEGVRTAVQRDPERYYFSVFGEPGGMAPWAWRVGGHHIGLHFTIVDGTRVAPTPLFFGANPAEVRHGPARGYRALADEEDLARALLASLDPARRSAAIVAATAPTDILTGNSRRADLAVLPRGIAYPDLSGEQRHHLVALVRHYVERAADHLAATAWARIERTELESLAFAWAGPHERGRGHYYTITGTTFMIEYDNTQNGANHIHSVWRDAANDWGEDLLAAHYRAAHRP